MKVLFYSEKCKYSSELIKKLKDTKFSKEFQHVNIDCSPVPSQIKVVPTIIDPEYKDLLEGKKAFEYIFNKKYFDNPTNNLLFWKDKDLPNPDIKEDRLANQNYSSLGITDTKDENKDKTDFFTIEPEKKDPPKKIKLKRTSLLRIRGRR